MSLGDKFSAWLKSIWDGIVSSSFGVNLSQFLDAFNLILQKRSPEENAQYTNIVNGLSDPTAKLVAQIFGDGSAH